MVRYSRWRGLTIPLIAFALAAASSAGAQLVVFNNFGPGNLYMFGSGWPEGGPKAGWVHPSIVGFRFLPSASGTLDKVELALSLDEGLNLATVYLVGDSSGHPDTGNVLESWITTSMPPHGQNNPPLVFPSVSHPMLNIGAPYWIYVDATYHSPFTVAVWDANVTAGPAGVAISYDRGATWFVGNATQGAFRVTVQGPGGVTPVQGPGGATPVPAAPVVSAIGAAVYGVCFFRKRRTA